MWGLHLASPTALGSLFDRRWGVSVGCVVSLLPSPPNDAWPVLCSSPLHHSCEWVEWCLTSSPLHHNCEWVEWIETLLLRTVLAQQSTFSLAKQCMSSPVLSPHPLCYYNFFFSLSVSLSPPVQKLVTHTMGSNQSEHARVIPDHSTPNCCINCRFINFIVHRRFFFLSLPHCHELVPQMWLHCTFFGVRINALLFTSTERSCVPMVHVTTSAVLLDSCMCCISRSSCISKKKGKGKERKKRKKNEI